MRQAHVNSTPANDGNYFAMLSFFYDPRVDHRPRYYLLPLKPEPAFISCSLRVVRSR